MRGRLRQYEDDDREAANAAYHWLGEPEPGDNRGIMTRHEEDRPDPLEERKRRIEEPPDDLPELEEPDVE